MSHVSNRSPLPHASTFPTRPGEVQYAPLRSMWLLSLLLSVSIWGPSTLGVDEAILFVTTTASTLCLGHSAGLHRGLIHGTYETSKRVERILVTLATLCGMGGPVTMARTHELRDTWQNKPASPQYYAYGHGIWRDFIWYLHSRHVPVEGEALDVQLYHEVARDPYYRFLDRHWITIHLPVALLLGLIGGWGWIIWGVCARVAVGNIGHWLVNFVAHTRGYRNFSIDGVGEQGANSLLFGTLSMGEGWHNNHHAHPESARIGLTWWEIDPGWWAIKTMRALGLVWNVVEAGDVEPSKTIDVIATRSRARLQRTCTPTMKAGVAALECAKKTPSPPMLNPTRSSAHHETPTPTPI